MGKAHKHAEAIKGWADGEEIEIRASSDHQWILAKQPRFDECYDYRIKPKPEYPTTLMDYHDMFTVWESYHTVGSGLLAIANAAIRHAIDSGQVIIAPKGE